MLPKKTISTIDRLYFINLLIKAFYGISEIILSIIVLIFDSSSITGSIKYIYNSELIEDPHDPVANYLLSLSKSLTGTIRIYVFIFFILHAAANLFVVWALVKKRIWAYYSAMCVLGGTITYQIFLLFGSQSILIIIAIVVDVLVFFLSLIEFRMNYGSY